MGDNGVVEIPAGVWFVGFLGSTSSALTQREIGEKVDPICQPCETGGMLHMLSVSLMTPIGRYWGSWNSYMRLVGWVFGFDLF